MSVVAAASAILGSRGIMPSWQQQARLCNRLTCRKQRLELIKFAFILIKNPQLFLSTAFA